MLCVGLGDKWDVSISPSLFRVWLNNTVAYITTGALKVASLQLYDNWHAMISENEEKSKRLVSTCTSAIC